MRFDRHAFVRWFRESSPYIHAHRDRTFVVYFGGDVFRDDSFRSLANDFALLNSLGIRLVLVHGIRPQIEQRLKLQDLESTYKNGLRITDKVALECVKEAAGTIRLEIEALMSMGVSNSPMAGAHIKISSGNFVTAKPLGVIDGTDFCFTGEVRRVDGKAIEEKLDQKNIVLISPIGYSPTGEIFNLSAEQLATSVATGINADKLLLLMEQPSITRSKNRAIHQITTHEAEQLIESDACLSEESLQLLHAATKACQAGVERVHMINRKIEGALLLELFTRDGIGTLVSSAPFETLRSATIDDIGGIIDLIRPLEKSGVLVKRSREKLETEIEDFFVLERDGLILGCASLRHHPNQLIMELACLVLHPSYQGEGRGDRLVEHVELTAKSAGIEQLFVLTTQTSHWFIERGFENADIAQLPIDRQSLYNYKRNSKVLIKRLSG